MVAKVTGFIKLYFKIHYLRMNMNVPMKYLKACLHVIKIEEFKGMVLEVELSYCQAQLQLQL